MISYHVYHDINVAQSVSVSLRAKRAQVPTEGVYKYEGKTDTISSASVAIAMNDADVCVLVHIDNVAMGYLLTSKDCLSTAYINTEVRTPEAFTKAANDALNPQYGIVAEDKLHCANNEYDFIQSIIKRDNLTEFQLFTFKTIAMEALSHWSFFEPKKEEV